VEAPSRGQYNGTMDIHQLSVDYSEEQDRILIRINTSQAEELRFWLTRRMTHKLWPTFNQVVASHTVRFGKLMDTPNPHPGTLDDSAQSLMADFHRNEALKRADFNTPYNSGANSLPLGEAPLVVTEVKLTSLGTGQLQIKLSEQLVGKASQRSCQLEVPTHLAHGLMHLLDQCLARSGWSDPAPHTAAQPDEPEAAPVEEKRPRYLN